ncbi:UNKNOWN [Stylonychia lemnae]|uniref:Uncharacterized protein n=1 Tax=Stylonychia lemnae TaxID=5949 RepID=A0A078A9T5_STYLE|nr:UNKNOWN [Stylonychia lemnae]|eukprot:CDW78656.1 UNKNOWN [Stylonychia lemnae]
MSLRLQIYGFRLLIHLESVPLLIQEYTVAPVNTIAAIPNIQHLLQMKTQNQMS